MVHVDIGRNIIGMKIKKKFSKDVGHLMYYVNIFHITGLIDSQFNGLVIVIYSR